MTFDLAPGVRELLQRKRGFVSAGGDGDRGLEVVSETYSFLNIVAVCESLEARLMVVMVGRISWGALGFEKPLALALLVQYRC